ncbi:diguanylate cyclase [Nocardia sp. NRRL S-836]|uniref:GGDEF domain-containing protein n=1 Tax=Nocardia sp. NRRL S-836 TaxID=1519492 RepID=UPI0006AFB310|nr:GGDEF domain-containing protein [Nocardia sp. NRRL S-836]
MLAYVLLVDAAAAVLVVLTTVHFALTSPDVRTFAILAVAAVVHLEASRSIERLREITVQGTPYVNLKSLWVFTGVVLLPLPLVATLTAITYVYAWARVDGESTAAKKVFTASTFILASGVAAAVLGASGFVDAQHLLNSPLGLLVLVGAATAWWFVNYMLVVGVLALSDPGAPVRKAIGDLADQLVVAAALGLGLGMAALLTYTPWLVVVLMLTVLVLHRQFLLPQRSRQAQIDAKTGLLRDMFFTETATALLDRLRGQTKPATLLMIDLDGFKQVNDQLGHPAGDDLLRIVADALRHELRAGDLVGRFGGDEFVVLLPAVGSRESTDIGDRVLTALQHLQPTVTGTSGQVRLAGVPASIGAAVFPEHGTEFHELLLAADTAQQRAKQAGGNQLVVMAPASQAVAVPPPRG